MPLLRLLKYSSVLLFFRRYRFRFFRIVAAVLFALVTSLLYSDVQEYLEVRHPGALIYALAGKILIVYGALVFVLWQFRPAREARAQTGTQEASAEGKAGRTRAPSTKVSPPADRLSSLEDIERKATLRSRYDARLDKPGGTSRE